MSGNVLISSLWKVWHNIERLATIFQNELKATLMVMMRRVIMITALMLMKMKCGHHNSLDAIFIANVYREMMVCFPVYQQSLETGK